MRKIFSVNNLQQTYHIYFYCESVKAEKVVLFPDKDLISLHLFLYVVMMLTKENILLKCSILTFFSVKAAAHLLIFWPLIRPSPT